MSRLDRMIDRLIAQRAIIGHVAKLIEDLPGTVFELGLGNGRTFDHLRETFPDREIFVFDRQIGAHPSCIPDASHLVLGDIRDTLRLCGPRIPAKPALTHIDLGSGDPTADAITAEWLPDRLQLWVPSSGYVIADRELDIPGFSEIERPARAPKSSHHIYCRSN